MDAENSFSGAIVNAQNLAQLLLSLKPELFLRDEN
jgi:hypothetical protein